jgi:preprotein translocase subunit YajC
MTTTQGLEVTVTDVDLTNALNIKASQVVSLEVQVSTLTRVLKEATGRVEELEKQLASLNGKEPVDAKSR